jgi:hypothetical protein
MRIPVSRGVVNYSLTGCFLLQLRMSLLGLIPVRDGE